MTDFEPYRRHCFALAYRMLGSAADAEDVVQEAWLRFRGAESVQAPRAWLTRAVTRLCLDQLKSARHRREKYVGPWLPEPVETEAADEFDAESISTAFLLLLERLTPRERAVFLLRKVFDVDYPEVARLLDQSESNVRQLFHRAQRHVRENRPRFAASADDHRRLLEGFVSAVQSGNPGAIESLLAEDARAFSDGGGKARAALEVVRGRTRVAKLYWGLARKHSTATMRMEVRHLNGWPGLVIWEGDRVSSTMTLETDGQLVYAIHAVLNPDKLPAFTPKTAGANLGS